MGGEAGAVAGEPCLCTTPGGGKGRGKPDSCRGARGRRSETRGRNGRVHTREPDCSPYGRVRSGGGEESILSLSLRVPDPTTLNPSNASRTGVPGPWSWMILSRICTTISSALIINWPGVKSGATGSICLKAGYKRAMACPRYWQ